MNKVKRCCPICKGVFFVISSQIAAGKGKTCSKPCSHKWQAIIMSGRHPTKETLKKMSKAKKGRFLLQENSNWRGGEHVVAKRVHVYAPRHPHTHVNGYVLRARIVAERLLGRFLSPKEVIHHIDFNTMNDSPENLYLFTSNREHISYHNRLKTNQVDLITKSNIKL